MFWRNHPRPFSDAIHQQLMLSLLKTALCLEVRPSPLTIYSRLNNKPFDASQISMFQRVKLHAIPLSVFQWGFPPCQVDPSQSFVADWLPAPSL